MKCTLRRVVQKVSQQVFVITSSNTDRFKSFFTNALSIKLATIEHPTTYLKRVASYIIL